MKSPATFTPTSGVWDFTFSAGDWKTRTLTLLAQNGAHISIATLKKLAVLGFGFESLNEELDLTTAPGRAMAGLPGPLHASYERVKVASVPEGQVKSAA